MSQWPDWETKAADIDRVVQAIANRFVGDRIRIVKFGQPYYRGSPVGLLVYKVTWHFRDGNHLITHVNFSQADLYSRLPLAEFVAREFEKALGSLMTEVFLLTLRDYKENQCQMKPEGSG